MEVDIRSKRMIAIYCHMDLTVINLLVFIERQNVGSCRQHEMLLSTLQLVKKKSYLTC
jgi:hypothetical protein